MKSRIQIPETDLSLFPIGLGTVGAGIKWDGAEADRIFDTYIDMGGNVIDTARVYSDWIPPEIGRSERVIGDWLRRSGRRNEVILMTKGGHPRCTSPADDIHNSRCTQQDMRSDLEKSLKALGVDTIDIYFYHRDNRCQSIQEELDIMEVFRREGKIRYYGCSNWQADRMLEADAYCKEQGYRGFAADQALLNFGMKYMNPMSDDTLTYIRDEIFAYHQNTPSNLAMPYLGVAGGFFHKFIEFGEMAVKGSPYDTEGNVRAAERCKELMEKYGASITQVLLGFFFHQPFACVSLYGPRDQAQLVEAMKTVEFTFESEDYML